MLFNTSLPSNEILNIKSIFNFNRESLKSIKCFLKLNFVGKYFTFRISKNEKLQTERKIWQTFKQGDRQALAVIFKNNYSVLYDYGLRICGDGSMVEDCLQDFFIYLFDHRKNLSDLDSIRPYLFKSFRRMLLRQMNKSSKIQCSNSPIDLPIPDIQFSAEDLMIKQEVVVLQNKVLLEMLNNLPKRQREVIYLRYYNDLSISEIEGVMSISYQGIVNKLHRAIKSLRKHSNYKLLSKYFPSFL